VLLGAAVGLVPASAAVLATALGGMELASASQLNLATVARQHFDEKQRCDLDGVSVTTDAVSGTTSTVKLAGIDPGCASRPIVVRIASGGSSTTTATTVPTGGGSMTITTASPAYDPSTVSDVSVMIDGWPTPGVWSYTAPPPPATECTMVRSNGWEAACSVQAVSASVQSPTDPVGQRTLLVYLKINAAPGYQWGDVFELDINLRDLYPSIPSNWVWATTGAASPDNLSPAPGFACSEMADGSLRAIAPSWAGNAQVFFWVHENRAGKSNLICS